MDKSVVKPYNKISFNKKEWNIDTCYNTDELRKHYAKSKKPVTKKSHTIGFHLYHMSRLGEARMTESILGVGENEV